MRAASTILALGCILLTGAAFAAESQSTEQEIKALRSEVQQLRQMLLALEKRLAELDRPAPSAPAPELEPSVPLPEPARTAPTWRENLQNPAIGVVFQATALTSLSREEDSNGFDLSEAEISFQSVVDPLARVDLFVAFPADESPEIEEAYATTLSLPGPLELRGGRFKTRFGKWNRLQSHAYFTVEKPDALELFLGEESLTYDGISFSVLIPNPWDVYVESVTEIGTAREGASFNSSERNLTYQQHLSALFDLTSNATLEVGATGAVGRTGPSEQLEDDIDDAGLDSVLQPRRELDSKLLGADLTYKWKPLGRNAHRSFLWQTEVLRSRQEREHLTAGNRLKIADVSSLGGYSYAEYQFTKRWRLGTRFDWSEFPDDDEARIRAGSAVVRLHLSEFQEIRFQYKYTDRNDAAAIRFGDETDDHQIFLEWIPSIGAHAAHKY
jgi:hypothetical protein